MRSELTDHDSIVESVQTAVIHQQNHPPTPTTHDIYLTRHPDVLCVKLLNRSKKVKSRLDGSISLQWDGTIGGFRATGIEPKTYKQLKSKYAYPRSVILIRTLTCSPRVCCHQVHPTVQMIWSSPSIAFTNRIRLSAVNFKRRLPHSWHAHYPLCLSRC